MGRDHMFVQTVQVAFETQVFFTLDLFAPSNSVLAEVLRPTGSRRPRLLATVETGITAMRADLPHQINYTAHYGIDLVEPPLVIEGGEAIKHSLVGVQTVLEAINRGDIDRHSYVMAVGGGAFLDAVRFAAATAHRGVRLIRVPTTVLSQNDSGVGVKSAINYFGKKNWWGAFQPPFAVLNDARFLQTLPERDWRTGMAEAVKIALIRDAEFFALLEEDAAKLAGRSMPR